MAKPSLLSRLRVDPYIVLLVTMVVLASILPARGEGAVVMGYVTDFAIALLFFLYGARLSREAVVAGMTNWRLQIIVFLFTYAVFPLLGLGLSALARPWLGPAMAAGLVFLAVLPSTVQSSIAFTSIARGNVAAALCCASVSNLVGIVLTPLLVGLLMTTQGVGFSTDSLRDIALQLFLPFFAGQVLRRWVNPIINRHKTLTGYVDRSSILLVVYTAFSEGVVNGLWSQVDAQSLIALLVVNAVLLAIVLTATTVLARRLGFSREDEIVIVFCGSKKSLASGIPMAGILFAGQAIGLTVLPLMLFHQIQLMVCAWLAQRYGRQAAALEAAQAVLAAAPPAAVAPATQRV
ncbi:bile acid:sodium symporter family protein [Roseomonas sp. BN140053]|uniref:bile acid:sodium symporter family protein n=1 Tax=Roseomonas sp. BN140053 TaxID=3391898 RepID=UPI0039ECF77F